LASVTTLFLPLRLPGEEAIIAEMSRLARRAQSEGGLLALQGESPDFAGGFLNRAINVAIATGESHEARRVLETEIRQLRIRRQEDANLLRTMGTLSPMFGLLGTLIGMIKVLQTVSTPTKVGPAMALALSSAFVGIASANLVCVPLAGQIRLRTITETILLEMILEGVLDIAAGKPSSLVEMHLVSYAQSRQRGAAAPAPRGAPEPV
jgi:chemotaxis protein MotA